MHASWMLQGREMPERCRMHNDCWRCQLLRLPQRLHDQIRWILRRYVIWQKRHFFKASTNPSFDDNRVERHANFDNCTWYDQSINRLLICRYKRMYRRTSSLRLRCRMHQSTRRSSMRVSTRIRRRSVQRPLLSSPEEMYQRQRM